MENKKRYLSFVILVLGFAMMFYGMSNGEMQIVVNKAINICFECIGLG